MQTAQTCSRRKKTGLLEQSGFTALITAQHGIQTQNLKRTFLGTGGLEQRLQAEVFHTPRP